MNALQFGNTCLFRAAVRLFSVCLSLVLGMGLLSAPPITSRAPHQAWAEEPNLAQFGDWVALESFTPLGVGKPVPGYPFEVVLNWRGLSALDHDLIASLSLNSGSRTAVAQVDVALPAGMQAGQHFSTTHTLLVPEVSVDTTLFFVSQQLKDAPTLLQLAVRDAQHNQRVPLTFAQTTSRRSANLLLATWSRTDLALTECHPAEVSNATHPITLTWPTTGDVTQGYWFAHRGADFADVRGKPVRAAWAGKVVLSEWNFDGYGFVVEIQHQPLELEGESSAHDFQTLYAHLDQINVNVGQRVKAGQVIGKMGGTGNVTGPHLHFEVRLDRVPKNPFCFLPLLVQKGN